jgi:hypothetical protein
LAGWAVLVLLLHCCGLFRLLLLLRMKGGQNALSAGTEIDKHFRDPLQHISRLQIHSVGEGKRASSVQANR